MGADRRGGDGDPLGGLVPLRAISAQGTCSGAYMNTFLYAATKPLIGLSSPRKAAAISGRSLVNGTSPC